MSDFKTGLFFSALVLITSLAVVNSEARQQAEEQEVYLSFYYQNAVSSYVTAIYRDDQFYIPQTELFRILQIDQSIDVGLSRVTGRYLDIGAYSFNYSAATVTLDNRVVEMDMDDFLVRELDYFIRPSILQELFDLNFSVNFNTLTLQLETSHLMPILAQQQRDRRREQTLRNIQNVERVFYPLRYDRNIHVLNGGFIDYNLTANISPNINNYLINSAIGMEVAGGDLQGSIFSNLSKTNQTIRSQNLRWQFGIRNSPWISKITAGQSASQGLRPSAITGIQITNEPLEPRYLFDDYVLSGSTVPDSEVELLRNNALVSWQNADDFGDYRFVLPLTYGTTRYNLRIYTPGGEVINHLRRIQVPFSFNPPGKLNYTVSAGRLDNPIPGTPLRGYTGRGGAVLGVTNWLSLNGGVEYFENFHNNLPTFTGGLSTRLFSKYLVSVEAASEAFYRANVSVYYGNGTNVSVDYTHYNYQGGLYNPSRAESVLRTSFFTPVNLGDLPIFFRGSVSHDRQVATAITRYRLEMNMIANRINFRMGFRDSRVGKLSLSATPASILSASARFSFPRSESTPGIFRGVFLRGQVNYAPVLNRVIDTEIQTNRRFLGEGRIQLAVGKNFTSNFHFFRVNLSFDFNSIRANTSARSTRGSYSVSQSLRGSIGLDSRNGRASLSNRQQVGQAGLAVRMFVDDNDNGRYDDDEELINQPAIRVEQAGGLVQNRNGIIYVSQLQPYRQYNLIVNKTALLNPLLVPAFEQFSFVSDPNQFKTIDIPLYYSGVIEGRVVRRIGETESALAGVRLLMIQTDHEEGEQPFTQELNTFSDGSFYAWEIPPASYDVVVDPVQLDFLQAETEPDVLKITVRALSEGDFVTGLKITVVPRDSGPGTGTEASGLGSVKTETGDAETGDPGLQEINNPDSVSENPVQPEREAPQDPVTGPVTPELVSNTGEAPQERELTSETDREGSFSNPPLVFKGTDVSGVRVQLGAFSTLVNAQEYIRSLRNSFDLDAVIIQTDSPVLFRVHSHPVPATIRPEDFLNDLKEKGLGDGIHLIGP